MFFQTKPSLFFLKQLQAKYLKHCFPDEETGSEDWAQGPWSQGDSKLFILNEAAPRPTCKSIK